MALLDIHTPMLNYSVDELVILVRFRYLREPEKEIQLYCIATPGIRKLKKHRA